MNLFCDDKLYLIVYVNFHIKSPISPYRMVHAPTIRQLYIWLLLYQQQTDTYVLGNCPYFGIIITPEQTASQLPICSIFNVGHV